MFKAVGRLVHQIYVRLSYDDYTIAQHFREQGATVGFGNRILIRDLGSEPYLVSIGDECLISSSVAFYTHDGACWVLRFEDSTANRFARIHVGSRCFIGARTILLPGAHIGDGSVIGAGSIVAGEIPLGVVAVGSPARPIRSVAEWAKLAKARALPLSEEFFPLDQCDRAALRKELERLLPLPRMDS